MLLPLLLQVAMLTWSYFAALITDPGEVPIGWHPFPDDAVRSSARSSSCTRTLLLTVHTSVRAGWQRAASKQTEPNDAADAQLRWLAAERSCALCCCAVVCFPACTQTAARELELLQFADYYIDRRDPRRPRFCKHCKSWKPERTHHCSVMGRCVLKMVGGWIR
jgi:hypothetical protein